MRLSDLAGKEVINLGDGSRLGLIDECELTFDDNTGRILAVILPSKGGLFSFFGDHRGTSIPWQAIKRIGDEVIIVDLNNAYERMYSPFRRERRESEY